MLDVPKLGLELLNNATHHLAATEDDPDSYESSMAIFDAARKLVGRTKLRKALAETAMSATDHSQRERDVMHALTEVIEIRQLG